MIIDDLFHDKFEEVTEGSFLLKDNTFEKVSFNRVTIAQNSHNRKVTLENINFENCKVPTFNTFGEVEMVSVRIHNLNCNEIRFTPEAKLDNVKISGSKTKFFFVDTAIATSGKNIEGLVLTHPRSRNGICLDVSEFEGMMSIYHAKPENIRLNPNLHFCCSSEKLDSVPVNDELRSSPAFRRMLGLAESSATGYLIESLKGKNRKITTEVTRVVNILRERNLIE